MNHWRFDPADYAPSTPLYVSEGYYDRSISEYTVTKVTPSGQVVAALNSRPEATIRVNKHGTIIGEDGWSRRHVVGPDRAADLKREAAERRRWLAVRVAAEKIEKAARQQSEEQLVEALAELAASVDTLPKGQDREDGLGARKGSAVPQAGAHP